MVYDRCERFAGETKYPLRNMFALSGAAVTSFSNAPLRMITLIAIAGIGVLLAISGWVIWTRLFTNLDVPG